VSTRVAATLRTLQRRAAMLSAIRAFFAARDVLEVETPALSTAGVTDPAIESIAATVPRFSAAPLYLHTSPEFAMKRLLAAGSGDIYQLCRVFRADELGRWHQPEFTLLEWYRLGFDDERLIGEVAELVAVALRADADGPANRGERAVVRVRYADAFERVLGVGVDAPTPVLAARLRAQGVDVPAALAHDATLDLALGTVVVASFDPAALTFVHDYPASQAALARLKPTTPPVAARFELFCGGLELANGFHELTDEAEQRRRFVAERAARAAAGRSAPPIDEALLNAMRRGLPDCAGVALGFDRLVALAIGASELAEAVSLVHERAP
jgi:lysyl-tRNA synthetase class 2